MKDTADGASNSKTIVLESSVVEPLSDDESCGLGRFCKAARLDSGVDVAPIQGVVLPQVSPVESQTVEAFLSPRSSCLATVEASSDLQNIGRVVSDDTKLRLQPELVQEEREVDVTDDEGFTRPMESLPMVLFDGALGEGPTSPLSCTSINMVGPLRNSPTRDILGDGVDALSQPSRWVNHQMNMFRKQVGVSIKG
jgi:hypothetical protein